MPAPSPEQIAYLKTLWIKHGKDVKDIPTPKTMAEMRDVITGELGFEPATVPQINLCEMLLRYHAPTMDLPEDWSSAQATKLIRKLHGERPTLDMLTELAQMEKQAEISSGRQPTTTQEFLRRRQRAQNMLGGDVMEQLIDRNDAEAEDWASALIAKASTATAEQADLGKDEDGEDRTGESVPESEGSSVRTRKGAST